MSILSAIEKKIYQGERLSTDDARELYHSDDLLGIGRLAAYANKQKNGDRVYFNVNRHINPTNVCVNQCAFCAFSRTADAEDAYTLTQSEMVARAEAAAAEGATEVHLVGGLHPDLPFHFYIDLLRKISAAVPTLHIKAFTAVEIDYFASISGLSIEAVLQQLIEAGLGSMPGGGAEILGDTVRRIICPEKIPGDQWLAIHEIAHRLGLKTNATMLYGHVESVEDRIEHMRLLRELQDRTGGFQVFIPLAWQPENSPLKLDTKGTSGLDDLKTLAIARLFLDNFTHLKAYWVMLGEKIAQVSLSFGVNDLDGTVVEEQIGHQAGAASPQSLSITKIVNLIRVAGKIPVERDTLYNPIREFSNGETL